MFPCSSTFNKSRLASPATPGENTGMLHRAFQIGILLLVVLFAGTAAAQDRAALQARAEAGEAQAQYDLARAYERGQGLPQSDQEAVHWLTAAAVQDHPEAALDLGWMLANGYGVEKDAEQAFYWFARAAVLGVEAAAGQRDAIASELDPERRTILYADAIVGLPEAQANPPPMSLMAESDPVLLPEDTFNALRDQINAGGSFQLLAKLRLLARDGDIKARNLLGLALRRSTDAGSRAEGLQWLFSAAKDGLPAAQFNLASALMADVPPGAGRSPDYTGVLHWLRTAELGSAPADPNDYTAVAREFAERSGMTDPYRAALQGSEGAYVELRQLITMKRQEVLARQDYDRLVGTPAAPTGEIETTVIE